MKKLWEYIKHRVQLFFNGYMIHTNEPGSWHRINGPAFESCDGFNSWWYNGELHRYYGPVRYWKSGATQYWIHGVQIK